LTSDKLDSLLQHFELVCLFLSQEHPRTINPTLFAYHEDEVVFLRHLKKMVDADGSQSECTENTIGWFLEHDSNFYIFGYGDTF
jgi:hypothetical protein